MIRLRPNNPYSNGQIVQFKDGTYSLDRAKVAYISSPNDEIHIVTNSDSLSYLAGKYYKDSKYWWLIADINDIRVNPILEFSQTYIGKAIIIPDLIMYKALGL